MNMHQDQPDQLNLHTPKVDVVELTNVEVGEVREGALRDIEPGSRAGVALVDDRHSHLLAPVVKVDLVTTAVRRVPRGRRNQVRVGWARTTAVRVVKHVATVPGDMSTAVAAGLNVGLHLGGHGGSEGHANTKGKNRSNESGTHT